MGKLVSESKRVQKRIANGKSMKSVCSSPREECHWPQKELNNRLDG